MSFRLVPCIFIVRRAPLCTHSMRKLHKCTRIAIHSLADWRTNERTEKSSSQCCSKCKRKSVSELKSRSILHNHFYLFSWRIISSMAISSLVFFRCTSTSSLAVGRIRMPVKTFRPNGEHNRSMFYSAFVRTGATCARIIMINGKFEFRMNVCAFPRPNTFIFHSSPRSSATFSCCLRSISHSDF